MIFGIPYLLQDFSRNGVDNLGKIIICICYKFLILYLVHNSIHHHEYFIEFEVWNIDKVLSVLNSSNEHLLKNQIRTILSSNFILQSLDPFLMSNVDLFDEFIGSIDPINMNFQNLL